LRKNEKEVTLLIENKIKELKNVKIELIAIPKGINQEINDYKTKSAHIRGCIYSNKIFGTMFNKGNKNMFIYIKKVPLGFPYTDVIAFEDPNEIPEGFEIDYEKMIENLIINKIKRIYEALGWNFGSITYSNQQKLKFYME